MRSTQSVCSRARECARSEHALSRRFPDGVRYHRAMDSRCWVLGLLLVGACKAELSNNPGDDTGTPDASTTKPPDGGGGGGIDGQTGLGPWGTPERVPGADTTADEDDSTLSWNRLELYFKRDDGVDTNLYVMTRATPTGTF